MTRFLVPVSLVLALLIAAPRRADADCTSGFLAPGSTVCVSTGTSAVSSATVTASSDVNVRWDVYVTINPTTTLLHEERSTGFTASYSAGTGVYSACATRGSEHQVGANFSLCITSP